jgi:hypothetical protein
LKGWGRPFFKAGYVRDGLADKGVGVRHSDDILAPATAKGGCLNRKLSPTF